MKTTKRFWLMALVALVVGTISFFVPSWLMSAQDETIAIIGGYRPSYWLLAASRCGGLFVLIAWLCGAVAVLALLFWLYHALSKDGLRKTSVLFTFLGVACSFGLYCGLKLLGIAMAQAAFGGVVDEHPFETAGSSLGILIALLAVTILIWRIVAQKNTRTNGAVMADLLLFLVGGAITFLPWGLLEGTGSWLVHLLGW